MKKTFLSLLLILSLLFTCVAVFPAEALAATDVYYLDATGVEKTAPTATEITETTDILTTGWYVVNADVTRAESIIVEGDVHLILANGYTLKVTGDNKRAGIDVSEENSLTIYGQENATGKLIANSGSEADHTGGAAIGGGFKENAGNITINGGHIKAASSGMGAGIGGGNDGHCGVVTINAGTVDASCLRIGASGTRGYGAGIGSGDRVGMKDDTNKKGVNEGKIIINGGNIRATSNVGAGIGGGFASDGGVITISGGTIYARSVGDSFWDYGSGAGIGGGCGLRKYLTDYEAIGGNGGNITITGGTITAMSENMGAGIGGGAIESNNTTDPVIGGSGGNINISGGTINAMSSLFGAGIGGGRKGDGGNVHITGGTVFANSREANINDIGGGKDYLTTDGTLTISGSSAVFLRNNKSSQPVNTSSHYHKTFSNATEVDDYTVPPNIPHPPGLTNPPNQPEWNSEFGAWLKGELYTVSFDSDGGSEVAAITKVEGAEITAPPNPTREGYTFDGWDKAIPETMPAEDMTLIAQWQINKYTITFDSDGGIEVPDITLDYGATITAPPNPTREGYTFDGWDKAIPETMPAENIMLTAKWKKVNQYTITFDSAGGSSVDSITQAEETTITAPEDPTREGYTFDGWDKAIPETMPAENITLTAKWKIIKKPQPTDPTEPKNPVDPADPKDPADPVDPKDPTAPADPVKPIEPVEIIKPTLPKTGSVTSSLLYGLGGLLILIGLVLGRKRSLIR